MGAIASQITSLTIVYLTVYSGADQSKYQSSASLAFVWGIHRGPVNSPHKWPVTRKMFPFDDVIMVNVTQTVPDISPLMPMHQDPLLVTLCGENWELYHRVLSATSTFFVIMTDLEVCLMICLWNALITRLWNCMSRVLPLGSLKCGILQINMKSTCTI